MTDLSKFDKNLLAEYREAFALFDKDGDGCITTKELGRVMKSLEQSSSQQQKQSGICEPENDGHSSIEFSEFVAMMERRKTDEELMSEIRETFRVFDRDQDGFISPRELRHVISNLGIKITEQEAAEMIAEADFNRDGLVDFQEFYKMMTYRLPPKVKE